MYIVLHAWPSNAYLYHSTPSGAKKIHFTRFAIQTKTNFGMTGLLPNAKRILKSEGCCSWHRYASANLDLMLRNETLVNSRTMVYHTGAVHKKLYQRFYRGDSPLLTTRVNSLASCIGVGKGTKIVVIWESHPFRWNNFVFWNQNKIAGRGQQYPATVRNADRWVRSRSEVLSVHYFGMFGRNPITSENLYSPYKPWTSSSLRRCWLYNEYEAPLQVLWYWVLVKG